MTNMNDVLDSKLEELQNISFSYLNKTEAIASCKQEHTLTFNILLILSIISSALLMYADEDDILTWWMGIAIFIVFGLLSLGAANVVGSIIRKTKKGERAFLQKCVLFLEDLIQSFTDLEKAATPHLETLSKKKKELITTDEYGTKDDTEYLKEIELFSKNIILKKANIEDTIKIIYKINHKTKIGEDALKDEDIPVKDILHSWLKQKVNEFEQLGSDSEKYKKTLKAKIVKEERTCNPDDSITFLGGLFVTIIIAIPFYFYWESFSPQVNDPYKDSGKISAWKEYAKSNAADRLKDPSSAQFSEIAFYKSNVNGKTLPIACGQINGKNSFGAYMGYQKFISSGKGGITYLEEDMEHGEFLVLWHDLCK